MLGESPILSTRIWNLDGNECTQELDSSTNAVDTSSCIANEMGTVFLSHVYEEVRNLSAEYGLQPEVSPVGRAIFTEDDRGTFMKEDLGEFTSSVVGNSPMQGTGIPFFYRFIPSLLRSQVVLVDTTRRYIKLHKEVFGKLQRSMPKRLNQEQLQRIDMPYGEFLKTNNLRPLEGLLKVVHSAQGYGYLSTVPSFYGLWWITPDLLHGFVQQSFHDAIEDLLPLSTNSFVWKTVVNMLTSIFLQHTGKSLYRTTTVLPEGFEKLWNTINDREELEVRFGVKDLVINRQLHDNSAPVLVSYTFSGTTVNSDSQEENVVSNEEFDFLIYTGPHASVDK